MVIRANPATSLRTFFAISLKAFARFGESFSPYEHLPLLLELSWLAVSRWAKPCLVRVKSRHSATSAECPLYPDKRTSNDAARMSA
jgi:hypothetical protein